MATRVFRLRPPNVGYLESGDEVNTAAHLDYYGSHYVEVRTTAKESVSIEDLVALLSMKVVQISSFLCLRPSRI